MFRHRTFGIRWSYFDLHSAMQEFYNSNKANLTPTKRDAEPPSGYAKHQAENQSQRAASLGNINNNNASIGSDETLLKQPKAKKVEETLKKTKEKKLPSKPKIISVLHEPDPRILESSFMYDEAKNKCLVCDVSAPNGKHYHDSSAAHRIAYDFYKLRITSFRFHSDTDLIHECCVRGLFYSAFPLVPQLLNVDLKKASEEVIKAMKFLKLHGVLRQSLKTQARNDGFNRLEWIGDLAIYNMIHDVVGTIFNPNDSSTVRSLMMSGMENNAHFGAFFNFVGLGEIMESKLANEMVFTKSDVFEAIVGELQLFSWGCEADVGCGSSTCATTKETECLRILAGHCRYALVTILILVTFRDIIGKLQPLMIRANEIENITYAPTCVTPKVVPPVQHYQKVRVRSDSFREVEIVPSMESDEFWSKGRTRPKLRYEFVDRRRPGVAQKLLMAHPPDLKYEDEDEYDKW